jgi:uncharacterized protein (TIGR02246 family)
MKKFLMLSGVALSLSVGTAMAQDKTQSCPVVTTEQIEALFTDFNAAWATKDPAKVTALFTKNPVLLATVSNTPRDTPEEIQDYFVGFLKNSPVGKIDTSEIEIDCNTASRVGTWTVTLTDAATGTKTDVKARYSFIYRFEDGSWKVDHLHSSAMPERSSKS